MPSGWKTRIVPGSDEWLCLVHDQNGYSAFISLASGLVHLFQDGGQPLRGATDDVGYLRISNLADTIEMLLHLSEGLNAIRNKDAEALSTSAACTNT